MTFSFGVEREFSMITGGNLQKIFRKKFKHYTSNVLVIECKKLGKNYQFGMGRLLLHSLTELK